jgi:hypothetical protein
MAIDWNKMVSVEVITTSAVLIFSVGVAYNTLAIGQAQADARSLNCKPSKPRCRTQYRIFNETPQSLTLIKSISSRWWKNSGKILDKF